MNNKYGVELERAGILHKNLWNKNLDRGNAFWGNIE